MRRWWIAAAGIATAGAVATVLAVALTRSSPAPPPAPLDDTFAGRATDRPQGLAPILRVGGPAADRAYLRFDLRRRGGIRRAVLRLTVLRGSGRAIVVRRIGAGTWGECLTTGADAPPVVGAGVRARVAPGPGTREIDVTRLVRGGGVVGLALTAPSGSPVEIASRERADGAPRLEITGGGRPAGARPPPAGLPAPPAGAVAGGPRDRFGIAAGSAIEFQGRAGVDRWLRELSALGAGWVRIDVQWSLVQERGPAGFDWSRSDRLIRGAVARGVKVVAMIGYTPPWAVPAGVHTDKSPPADPAAFARFAAGAVRRYSRLGVHDWEIWNEPNLAGFWGPRADPGAYAALVERAAPAIRAADPRAIVVLGVSPRRAATAPTWTRWPTSRGSTPAAPSARSTPSASIRTPTPSSRPPGVPTTPGGRWTRRAPACGA